mmetsp:Transcript_16514/g.18828  ORF Transcript_16514/g.18828 Transcript_16514/m.18828 type:complete len:89 (-) Transcript_16514:730-996(-)
MFVSNSTENALVLSFLARPKLRDRKGEQGIERGGDEGGLYVLLVLRCRLGGEMECVVDARLDRRCGFETDNKLLVLFRSHSCCSSDSE